MMRGAFPIGYSEKVVLKGGEAGIGVVAGGKIIIEIPPIPEGMVGEFEIAVRGFMGTPAAEEGKANVDRSADQVRPAGEGGESPDPGSRQEAVA